MPLVAETRPPAQGFSTKPLADLLAFYLPGAFWLPRDYRNHGISPYPPGTIPTL